jgi:hypothetical protein
MQVRTTNPGSTYKAMMQAQAKRRTRNEQAMQMTASISAVMVGAAISQSDGLTDLAIRQSYKVRLAKLKL